MTTILLILLLIALIVLYIKKDHLGEKATPLMLIMVVIAISISFYMIAFESGTRAYPIGREYTTMGKGSAEAVFNKTGPVKIAVIAFDPKGPLGSYYKDLVETFIVETEKRGSEILGITPPSEANIDEDGNFEDFSPSMDSTSLQKAAANHPEAEVFVSFNGIPWDQAVRRSINLGNRYLIVIDVDDLLDHDTLFMQMRSGDIPMFITRSPATILGANLKTDPDDFDGNFTVVTVENMEEFRRAYEGLGEEDFEYIQ